jgi:hypothetical protein
MKLKKIENLHIVFWLIKDACWAAEIKWLGVAMILPTLGIAIFILNKMWDNILDRYHNLAICFWITANATWMIGEFFKWDEQAPYLRKMALIPFSIGLIIIAYFYLVVNKNIKNTND